MSRVRAVAIGVGLLTVLGLLGLMCQRVGERGRFAVEYSTYGSGPRGTRALYLLAERLEMRPARWAEELLRLPGRGVLVALGGCKTTMHRALSRYEREALREWVEQGGVLLVAGAHQYLPKGYGVWLHRPSGQCDPEQGVLGMIGGETQNESDAGGSPPDAGTPRIEDEALENEPEATVAELSSEEPEPRVVGATAEAEALAGVGSVPMRRPAEIRTEDDVETETLLTSGDEPAAVAVPRGEGMIVALASASVFENDALESSGGAVLFARLVDRYGRDGPLFFDEYHLGMGTQRSLVRYIRQLGGMPIVAQLVLVAGLLLWRGGTRFGAVRRPPPPSPSGTASYVDGVGRLYAKARDPAGTLGIVVRHALSRIAAHHHLPPADWNTLARALDERGRTEEARAVRELGALEDAGRGDRKQVLVGQVRQVDALVARATVGHGRGPYSHSPQENP